MNSTEPLTKSTAAWIAWAERLGNDPLATYLRLVAAALAQPTAEPPAPSNWEQTKAKFRTWCYARDMNPDDRELLEAFSAGMDEGWTEAQHAAPALLPAPADVQGDSARLSQVDRCAKRYEWLRDNFCGVDFSYGEPPDEVSVITFLWPPVPISADLDASIDAALGATCPASPEEPKNG